nr:ABC transporter permease [Salana multivorans]
MADMDDIQPSPTAEHEADLAPAADLGTMGTQLVDKESLAAREAINPAVAAGGAAAPGAPSRKGWRGAQLMPRITPKLIVGLVLVVGIVAFALIAPLFTQDPKFSGNPAFEPPNGDHILGTTKLGYDVFAQLAYGAKGSLQVGLIAGLIALSLSIVFGIVAGYVGGFTDEALSLVTNVMLVIPGLPLMIVIASYAQQRSMLLVALILGVTGWAGAAVVLRSQARSLRSRDYVAASKVAGEKSFRIIAVEILPNLLPLLAAQFIAAVVLAILGEAGLSYLGLGPNGVITWGTMLNEAQTGNALSAGAWWWFIPPGLMISAFGCGLSLINFSIDEIINPKLRSVPAAARSVRKAKKNKPLPTASSSRTAAAPTGTAR